MTARKISELTALTTPASGDYLPIVDISEVAAADKNKRITIEELMRGAPNGTAAAPGIAFEGDPNTGIYSPGADQVAISTAGTGRLFVDASGNVGVGLTPASYAGYSVIGHGGTTGATLEQRVSGTLVGSLTTDSQVTLKATTAIPIVFSTSNTERLRITSDGKVGLGTSSPAELLHVEGSSSPTVRIRTSTIGSTASPSSAYLSFNGFNQEDRVRFEAQDRRSSVDGGFLNIATADSSNTLVNALHIDNAQRVGVGTTGPAASLHVEGADFLIKNGTGVPYVIIAGRSSDGRSELAFRDNTYASNNARFVGLTNQLALEVGGSEALRVDSSRRLLVGTTSTSGNVAGNDKLAVVITGNNTQGGISVTDYAGSSTTIGSYAALRLQRSLGTTDGSFTALTGSSWGLGRIEFNGSNGVGFGTGATIEGFVDSLAWGNGDHPARLAFSTTADGASSPTERMSIGNAGAIFIGSTARTQSGFIQGASDGLKSYAASTTGTCRIECFHGGSTTVYHQVFSNANGIVGSISTVASATAYNTLSDYRLKENITPVTDGITRLQQLKPSRFNFIADPTKTVDGFIAHEVQSVVPEAITGEKDAVDEEGNPQYQGIDQAKLVPLLTAALQEAVAKIESLEARLTAAGI